MIDKGYLKYENVAVAIDPEFRSYPGRDNPGIPIGTVQAWQINNLGQIAVNGNAATGTLMWIYCPKKAGVCSTQWRNGSESWDGRRWL